MRMDQNVGVLFWRIITVVFNVDTISHYSGHHFSYIKNRTPKRMKRDGKSGKRVKVWIGRVGLGVIIYFLDSGKRNRYEFRICTYSGVLYIYICVKL